MYSLYSSEVQAILNRCNASYATPYEFKENRFVQISHSKYINVSSWLAYFKWAHLLAMGLSLSQAVKVEGFEIRLLALGIGAFYLVESYVSAIYAKENSVREIIGLLNAVVKLQKRDLIMEYTKSKPFTLQLNLKVYMFL
jgi:hypothetical protein